jgi:hypothetical protein
MWKGFGVVLTVKLLLYIDKTIFSIRIVGTNYYEYKYSIIIINSANNIIILFFPLT